MRTPLLLALLGALASCTSPPSPPLERFEFTRIEMGMPVEVTFDAIPNSAFSGTIVRIAPMSTVEQGSTNYTVIVEVDGLDPSLRWGMTAFVNIETGDR